MKHGARECLRALPAVCLLACHDLPMLGQPRFGREHGIVRSKFMMRISTSDPQAEVRYTTDGSCPCDENARKRYEGPFVLTENVTIQAMAVCEGMTDSEVLSLTITVGDGLGVMEIADDETGDKWFDLNGRPLLSGKLPAGIYIHVRRNASGGTVSRKVLVK